MARADTPTAFPKELPSTPESWTELFEIHLALLKSHTLHLETFIRASRLVLTSIQLGTLFRAQEAVRVAIACEVDFLQASTKECAPNRPGAEPSALAVRNKRAASDLNPPGDDERVAKRQRAEEVTSPTRHAERQAPEPQEELETERVPDSEAEFRAWIRKDQRWAKDRSVERRQACRSQAPEPQEEVVREVPEPCEVEYEDIEAEVEERVRMKRQMRKNKKEVWTSVDGASAVVKRKRRSSRIERALRRASGEIGRGAKRIKVESEVVVDGEGKERRDEGVDVGKRQQSSEVGEGEHAEQGGPRKRQKR